jgi:hypothetical protein
MLASMSTLALSARSSGLQAMFSVVNSSISASYHEVVLVFCCTRLSTLRTSMRYCRSSIPALCRASWASLTSVCSAVSSRSSAATRCRSPWSI